MEPLRILLVGYGLRGRQWDAVLAGRADMRLAGIAEPDERAPAPKVPSWPSLDPPLDARRFDAAIIASPARLHPEQAIRCLEAGLAVLVEKPLATALVDAATVAEAAARTGRPALVGQNFRFRGHEQLLRQTLGAGAIGRPRAVNVVSRQPKHGRSAIDALWDYCSHHLDLLRTRFGDPFTVTSARLDGSEIRAELAWGSELKAAYRHREAAIRYAYRERIRGDRGSITLRETGLRARGSLRTIHPTIVSAEDVLLDELANAFHGATSSVSAADNLHTIALIEAVALAAAERRTVSPSEIWSEAGLARPVVGTEHA